MGESLTDKLLALYAEYGLVELNLGMHKHILKDLEVKDGVLSAYDVNQKRKVEIPVWIVSYMGHLTEKEALSTPIKYRFVMNDDRVSTRYDHHGFKAQEVYDETDDPALYDMEKLLPLYLGADDCFADENNLLLVSPSTVQHPRAYERWLVMEEDVLRKLYV